MSNWEVKYPIDYSANGDDIDTFAQKIKAEIALIYRLLNRLRQNSPVSGDLADTLPFQFHVDTNSGKFYMRNSENNGWNVLGEINKDYLGITAKNIGAVTSDGTLGKMSSGNASDMTAAGASTGDLFYAFDERRLYYFTGTSWDIFLSMNFADLQNYQQYCILRTETDYNGKDKVLRLDPNTGKGNIDITGSPERLLGYKIEVNSLKDGQVLVYDSATQKFVNKAKDEIVAGDISNNGGANKIIKTDSKGFANVSVSGSAAMIDGVEVKTTGIKNHQALHYDAVYKRFEPADTIVADITGSAEKISGVGLDSNLVNNQFLVFDGGTKKIVSAKNIKLDGAIDKQALVYDATDKKFKPADTIKASITGSAELISGIALDTNKLVDGQVFIYDSNNRKITSGTKNYLDETQVSSTGEIDKIVRLGSDCTVHANISGSASKIDNVKVNVSGIIDKKALAYNAVNNAFEPADMIAADITGSAKLFDGISIDAANLVDGNFLKFDAGLKRITSESKNYLSESDVSSTGDFGKVVRLGNDGILHANLDGSANKIGGIAVDGAGIKNGQVLAYDSATKKYSPVDKDYITEDKISETGEIGKLVRIGSDKTIHANVEGSVSKIDNVTFNLTGISGGDMLAFNSDTKEIAPAPKSADYIKSIEVDVTNMQDGQVLVYDAANNKLVPADKDFITASDISTTGEIGKLIRVAANTPLDIDITGSANALDGINVSASNPDDGDVLVYHESTKSFRTEPKGAVGAGKSLILKQGDNVIGEYNGSKQTTIDVSEAEKLSKARKIELVGHASGEVFFDGSSDVQLNVTTVTTTLADESDYATKAGRLANIRTISIGGLVEAAATDFDGTSDITLMVTSIDRTNADKLTTARKITFTGDIEGSGEFDGSADIVFSLTVSKAQTANSAATSANALNAMYSLRAEKDANGNVIADTYLTKEEFYSLIKNGMITSDTFMTDTTVSDTTNTDTSTNSDTGVESDTSITDDDLQDIFDGKYGN